MSTKNHSRRLVFCSVLMLLMNTGMLLAQQSQWAYFNSKGQLEYALTRRGDRILDFSYAGYEGGGVKLPRVKEVARLYPVAGDNTALIQQAIDEAAKLPLVDGFRGAVVLAPGEYACSGTIVISASGVVLRGSGSSSKILMTGKPHTAFRLEAPVQLRPAGNATVITDVYVPSGSNVISVADAREFASGDLILISKPVTPGWVRFMGMDTLVRDGKKQTWITGELSVERMITAVSGNKITVAVPLTDCYDASFTGPGTTVQKVLKSGGVQHAGVEYLAIEAPEQAVAINQAHHSAIRTRGLSDGWIRELHIRNTMNSVGINGQRITVEALDIAHTASSVGAAKPADLAADGAQLLFNRCTIQGNNVFFLATGAKVSGPVVLLNCTFKGNGWIQPHQRWATGLLIDGCNVPDGGIDFMNRGEMGSGHGWAVGWAVAWNCKAASYLNQQPPGAYNWVIGSTGTKQQKAMPFYKEPMLPQGIFDAHGTPVVPKSLYLTQLKERLGAAAPAAMGYAGEGQRK